MNSAQCVKNVSYQISSPEKIEKIVKTKSANMEKFQPDIFKRLLTIRKHKRNSELYDLVNDPKMLYNLLEKGNDLAERYARLRNILTSRYIKMSKKSLQVKNFEKTTSEELLKSLITLGYIQ